MIIKAVISGLIIAAASELAQRSPNLGALLMSLPFVSIMTFIWLWRDTGDGETIARLSNSIFLYFLPTLPMFVVLPMLLRAGVGFPAAMALAIFLTAGLYASLMLVAPILRS